MLCQAEYFNEGYFNIFEADDDWSAIIEAESFAEESDFVLRVFEITEDCEEVRGIL